MQSLRDDGLRRNVAILEGDAEARTRLLRLARDAGFVALGFSCTDDLVQALTEGWFDLVLVVSDAHGDEMSVLVSTLQTHLPPSTAVMLVLETGVLSSVFPFLVDTQHDFVLKPYVGEEVIARVQMLLRAPGQRAPSGRLSPMTAVTQGRQFGAYRLEPLTREVFLREECITLTAREFALALFLFLNPGQLWHRDELCLAAWGKVSPEGSRKLDTYISRLRSRLQLRSANGWRMSSVYRLGYRLDAITIALPDQPASAASMSPASLAGAS